MRELPVALTVAGSDSGGGAGIQADLKTMEACGVFATSAVTGLTAQNTRGVQGVEPVAAEFVESQIDSVVDDLDVDSMKTGMLGGAAVVEAVAWKTSEHGVPAVVDPVMVAESGDRLLDREAEEVVRDELVPEARLVTPNAAEAEVLTDVDVDDVDSLTEAGRVLVEEHGAAAALVKGGHLEGDSVVDVLYTEDGVVEYRKPRVDTDDTHGTGCTLSSAVAAELAKGESLEDAVAAGEDLVYRAVKYAHDVGEGAGPVHHLALLRNEAGRYQAVSEVQDALSLFREHDVSPLVPEVGLNFAAAAPYAESEEEVAAFDGRLSRTGDGVDSHGVRLGASGHVARFLLAAREHDPALSAACNVRNTEELREAVAGRLDTVEFDRSGEPEDASTMEWSAAQAFEAADSTPEAVVDRGAVGKEPMVRLLSDDVGDLASTVVELADAVR